MDIDIAEVDRSGLAVADSEHDLPALDEVEVAPAEEILPRREPATFRFAPLVRFSGHIWLVAVVALALVLQAGRPQLPGWLARVPDLGLSSAVVAAAGQGAGNAGGMRTLMRDVLPTPGDILLRAAQPSTTIPERPRRNVETYTVESGDTLFDIAGKFGLHPETILWSNPKLKDNPDMLAVGQELNILPVDGVYHSVVTSDTLQSIADAYQVQPADIQNAIWNQGLVGNDGALAAGANLVVPGGQREIVVWYIPPPVPANPGGTPGQGNGTANVGSCGAVPSLRGSGRFIWPTDSHWVSGNPYANWHRGIDLHARLGDNIYASDNGTVIYAGWSTVGYGNLVVIDHANGWQTWYAHLSQINVNCGDAIWQGTILGLAGSTGHSTGPHLHFETRWQGTLPNPLDILP